MTGLAARVRDVRACVRVRTQGYVRGACVCVRARARARARVRGFFFSP